MRVAKTAPFIMLGSSQSRHCHQYTAASIAALSLLLVQDLAPVVTHAAKPLYCTDMCLVFGFIITPVARCIDIKA